MASSSNKPQAHMNACAKNACAGVGFAFVLSVGSMCVLASGSAPANEHGEAGTPSKSPRPLGEGRYAKQVQHEETNAESFTVTRQVTVILWDEARLPVPQYVTRRPPFTAPAK